MFVGNLLAIVIHIINIGNQPRVSIVTFDAVVEESVLSLPDLVKFRYPTVLRHSKEPQNCWITLKSLS